MNHAVRLAAAAFALATAAGADAACPADTICAENPEAIVDLLKDSGYKARLYTDKDGDPRIDSAASGYDFEIVFYGCKEGKACNSVQFWAGWGPDDAYTIDFANRWNLEKRLLQMSVKPDKSMSVAHDLTTVGGMTPDNFTDFVSFWEMMLGELTKFYDANAG